MFEFPVLWIAHDLIRRTRWPLNIKVCPVRAGAPTAPQASERIQIAWNSLDYIPPISVGKVQLAQGGNGLNRRPVPRQSPSTSILIGVDEDRITQVEFPLDAPQHGIIYAAFVAQAYGRLTLHAQCLQR